MPARQSLPPISRSGYFSTPYRKPMRYQSSAVDEKNAPEKMAPAKRVVKTPSNQGRGSRRSTTADKVTRATKTRGGQFSVLRPSENCVNNHGETIVAVARRNPPSQRKAANRSPLKTGQRTNSGATSSNCPLN